MTQLHNPVPVSSKQILKGITMPERARAMKYPLDEMEVGDAIFGLSLGLGSSASKYGRESGKRFTTRPYTYEGTKGYMCWRVS